MSFLYIFKDYEDFKEILIGNIAYVNNKSYNETKMIIDDMFKFFLSEMKHLSKHEKNKFKFSPAWIDFETRRIYYFINGHLNKLEY